MLWPVFFFFAAMTVRQDQTPVRSACETGADTIASLPQGTAVDIRFRLADGTDCFKIAASVDGKDVIGYVSSSALAGLENFERERSTARSADTLRALHPIETEMRKAVANTGDANLDRAAQLLAANQPAQAFEILEPVAKRYGKNPSVLLLTGLAAYRSDQLRAALDYWKQSLDLAPNDSLARVYEKVKREAESDHSGEKLYGMRIALRYEGAALAPDAARAILSVLDEEYGRISSQLGCTSDERIVAIVQTRENYLQATGAAEWSGGQYDGRIHISWTEGKQVGPQMRRSLAHELVHACLTNLPSGGAPWPAWVQEGLAQKLAGDTLSTAARLQLRQLAQAHELPRLESLRQDWSRLSIENARLAYNLALAAAEALYENYSSYGIRNIMNNPRTLERITAELDRKLGL
jgi:hypothetical protein